MVPLTFAETEAMQGRMAHAIEQKQDIQRLNELIKALPLEEQELIYLRYVAELAFSDIAIILRRKEDTVKKSIYRLQGRLRRILEAENE